jgi:hypothetical protein
VYFRELYIHRSGYFRMCVVTVITTIPLVNLFTVLGMAVMATVRARGADKSLAL